MSENAGLAGAPAASTMINGQVVNTSTATAPAAAPSAPSDWTAGLQEDMRGYVQNKGFKDPAMVVESYRNFEKLMGVPKERLLQLPEKADAPEWGQIYDRLGRPKEAKEYMLPKEGSDEKTVNWAQDAFHKLGLSRQQGEKLFSEWNGYTQAEVAAQQQAQTQKAELEATNVKREWGAAFEQNAAVALRAAKEFGLDGPKIDAIEQALGYEATMKLLHSVGSKFSEDSFVTPGQKSTGFGGAMTPDAAKNRINALMQDSDWSRKYIAGGANERSEMQKLHEWANPET